MWVAVLKGTLLTAFFGEGYPVVTTPTYEHTHHPLIHHHLEEEFSPCQQEKLQVSLKAEDSLF